jgi:hypothetical protein
MLLVIACNNKQKGEIADNGPDIFDTVYGFQWDSLGVKKSREEINDYLCSFNVDPEISHFIDEGYFYRLKKRPWVNIYNNKQQKLYEVSCLSELTEHGNTVLQRLYEGQFSPKPNTNMENDLNAIRSNSPHLDPNADYYLVSYWNIYNGDYTKYFLADYYHQIIDSGYNIQMIAINDNIRTDFRLSQAETDSAREYWKDQRPLRIFGVTIEFN